MQIVFVQWIFKKIEIKITFSNIFGYRTENETKRLTWPSLTLGREGQID